MVSISELEWHEAVEYGVDGTVDVDHDPTEEPEPDIEILAVGQGVIHHYGSVWQP